MFATRRLESLERQFAIDDSRRSADARLAGVDANQWQRFNRLFGLIARAVRKCLVDWPEDELPALRDELDAHKSRLIALPLTEDLHELVDIVKPFSRRFRGLLVAASRARRKAKSEAVSSEAKGPTE